MAETPLTHVVAMYYAECSDCGWTGGETEDEQTASEEAETHECENG